MRAEFITPFLNSLSTNFGTLLGCEVHTGGLSTHGGRFHEVSAVVGFSGKALGMMILSLSEHVAARVARAMLLVETDGLNDDVFDAVSDLALQIAAGANHELAEYDLTPTLACIATGRNHRLHFPTAVTPLSAVCETPFGPVLLEVGLAPVSQVPAGAGWKLGCA